MNRGDNLKPVTVWICDKIIIVAIQRGGLALATGKQANNPDLTPYTPTPIALIKRLSEPAIGKKDGVYFIRSSGSKRTNNDTSDTADILIIDADSRIDLHTGEVVSGAVAAELVHRVLVDLGINHCIYSSYSNDVNLHKYRVIIFCRYSREQLPVLLDYLFAELHSNELMLAPVKENLTWSQAWFFPRVPDEQREALFEFYQFLKGDDLDADVITAVWLKEHPPTPTAKPERQPKLHAPQNSSIAGQRNPIEEFNQAFCVDDILKRNGYIAKPSYDMRWLSPVSETGVAGVQLAMACKDGVMRVYSHHNDVLNDGFAHDAFDCYRLLECGGDFKTAINWNAELTKHNQALWAKEQAANKKTSLVNEQQTVYDEAYYLSWESQGYYRDNGENRVYDADTGFYLEIIKGLEHTPLAFDFPTFDADHYYGIAGELSALATEDSEADRMAVYVSFLVATAALLDKDKYLRIGESRHYSRLFVTLVGASSRARKGTSFKPVVRIIRETEAILYDVNAYIALPPKKLVIADGGLSSAEGLIYQVRDESEDVNTKGVPAWSAVDDKRLLVVEEEFGNVLNQCKRDGNTLSPTLRRAWDGGDLAPMTKNNKLKATDPHINVLSHITQFELKCLMTDSDIHNGLANRFLWTCVRRTKKLAFPQPMNDSKVKALAERLADAVRQSSCDSEITLSTAARAYWAVKYHEVSNDESGVLGSVTARAEAHVMRLSLLFCLLDCCLEIERKHIEAACVLVEFCKKSVQYIFSTPAECEAGTDADKLLNALTVKPLSQTEVSKVFSGNKKRTELMTLLTELQTANKIKQTKETGSKKVIWSII